MAKLVRVLVVAVCVSLGVFDAASAAAQTSPAEAEARSVFDAGEVAFRDGRFHDALVYFKRSYALSSRPALLFNIGLCHDRLRDDDEAIRAYEQYLTEIPAATNRAEVDDRLGALRAARTRRGAAAQAVQPAHVAEAADEGADTSGGPVANAGPPGDAPTDGPAVYETWWFWAIVGVVVVGAAVGIVVAASGGETMQPGDLGGVVFTLGGGR